MHINFAMWRKASWELIKMDDKKEWDALDVISKWLIATRSAVTTVTIYSCIIAGMLAWRDGYFAWLPWIITTLGLFIAHGTNNLLNDYTDYSRGVDKDYYFRTQYGVHPLVQKFWTKSKQFQWFIVSGVLATLAGVFALFYTKFNPVIIGLFVFGAIVLPRMSWTGWSRKSRPPTSSRNAVSTTELVCPTLATQGRETHHPANPGWRLWRRRHVDGFRHQHRAVRNIPLGQGTGC